MVAITAAHGKDRPRRRAQAGAGVRVRYDNDAACLREGGRVIVCLDAVKPLYIGCCGTG
jgi:hypothetical protein